MKRYLLIFAAVAALAVPSSFGAAKAPAAKKHCIVTAGKVVCDCVSYGCGLWGQPKCPCIICNNQ